MYVCSPAGNPLVGYRPLREETTVILIRSGISFSWTNLNTGLENKAGFLAPIPHTCLEDLSCGAYLALVSFRKAHLHADDH